MVAADFFTRFLKLLSGLLALYVTEIQSVMSVILR